MQNLYDGQTKTRSQRERRQLIGLIETGIETADGSPPGAVTLETAEQCSASRRGAEALTLTLSRAPNRIRVRGVGKRGRGD